VRGSQPFLKFGKPYYVDKLHSIKIYATLHRYVQENEFRSFEVYCITLSAHFVKKKKTLKIKHYLQFGTQVIRTHVFTSAEIESFALRHRLKNWKMERNCSFQRLVGGQCGRDPRSNYVQDLVPFLTCNKDISRHKSSVI